MWRAAQKPRSRRVADGKARYPMDQFLEVLNIVRQETPGQFTRADQGGIEILAQSEKRGGNLDSFELSQTSRSHVEGMHGVQPKLAGNLHGRGRLEVLPGNAAVDNEVQFLCAHVRLAKKLRDSPEGDMPEREAQLSDRQAL